MEKVTTLGIDLAKRGFDLHGVDGAGRTLLRRTVRREQLVATIARCTGCARATSRSAPPHQPYTRRLGRVRHRAPERGAARAA